MIFREHWTRLINLLIQKTPGIGHPEEADKAIKRSRAAMNDSYRVHDAVASNAEYLSKVVRDNHFRDSVAEALSIRR